MASNTSGKMKVWGVGLSRTGTTSLCHALGALGMRAVHYPDPAPMFEGDFGALRAIDAATDIPVAHWFETIDGLFPGSRFVLTVRDPDAWADGLLRHLRVNPAADKPEVARRMRCAVYGCEDPDRASLRETYRRHEARVRGYFADRPGDLLVLDICAGDGWAELCPFLGVSEPAVPFPHQRSVRGNAALEPARR